VIFTLFEIILVIIIIIIIIIIISYFVAHFRHSLG